MGECLRSRAHARGRYFGHARRLALARPSASPVSDAASESVLVSRELIERLQAQVKFEQTRNEALNFEIARLKRWRFGSSAESLEASTQAVLFDAILADTALEDSAAKQASKPPPAAPSLKGQAVRQALPAKLPRVDRHCDIGATHCACGQAFKRIGEDVSEQLDCVPAQFFVLRHIRGKYACACCQTIQAAPMPAQMIDKGIPAAGLLAQVAIAKLYEIERELKELKPEDRLLERQLRSRPVADALHARLTTQRLRLVKADATARAIDYSLSNWPALTTFLGDGAVPIDNNAAENAIRPLAVGRKNWLFVGSRLAGERAAVLVSLIESAKLNGHDPWAYLKDVFERLPTLKNRDLAQLPPHNWRPASAIVAPATVAAAEPA
jgi:hypothetical protein